MGFSMGGNGAIICAAKQPERFAAMTAFSPVGQPTDCDMFCKKALTAYFGSPEAGADWSAVEVLNAKGTALKLPPGFIDVAANDQFINELNWPQLIEALNTNGHNTPVTYHEDYNHSWYFVNDFLEAHIDFHAAHLYK